MLHETAAEVREEEADGMVPEAAVSGADVRREGVRISSSRGSSTTCHAVLVVKVSSVLPPGLPIVAAGSSVTVR